MTKKQAKSFWRDLMGTLWKDPDTKVTHGIMGAGLIADHMGITTSKAEQFMYECTIYGFTERQGGGWVV